MPSLRPCSTRTLALLAVAAFAANEARAQYSTPVGTGAAKAKTLRATAVLEWTGELAKPNASRLMPIAVWDGEQYQPAGLYLAAPAPLAFEAGTQYVLERAGDPVGLFEVRAAAQLFGQWIGMGKFQAAAAPPPPKPLKASKTLPREAGGKDTAGAKGTDTAKTQGSADTDRPTLHRKTGNGADSPAAPPAAPATTTAKPDQGSAGSSADPDRPTLHKRSDSQASPDSETSKDGSGTTSQTGASTNPTGTKAPDVDPDRPTLHRPTGAPASADAASDPDRPTLHRAKEAAAAAAPTAIDPDRPRLRHGRPEEGDNAALPAKLEGAPAEMQKLVAVSDAAATPDRDTYAYKWSSLEDAAKMQSLVASLALKALNAAQAQATRAAARSGATFGPQTQLRSGSKKSGAAKAKIPAGPALVDEQFSAYELSFSAGATLVYSAHTDAEPAQRVYVTLIAQPDFNGQPEVLFTQTSRGDRLDQTPSMRLVDAVDTDGDRRAELVFELTGGLAPSEAGAAADSVVTAAGRGPEHEFAIYRVAGRRATQVFTTGPLP